MENEIKYEDGIYKKKAFSEQDREDGICRLDSNKYRIEITRKFIISITAENSAKALYKGIQIVDAEININSDERYDQEKVIRLNNPANYNGEHDWLFEDCEGYQSCFKCNPEQQYELIPNTYQKKETDEK